MAVRIQDNDWNDGPNQVKCLGEATLKAYTSHRRNGNSFDVHVEGKTLGMEPKDLGWPQIFPLPSVSI